MKFDRNDIKVSFAKPQYQTNGKEVKCTLRYAINVPEMNHFDNRWDKDKGYNPACVETSAEFSLGQVHTAVGTAKCNADDTFDKKTGREIAEARAEAKAYKHAAILVKKYVASVAKAYYNFALDFEQKADRVQRHNEEYVANLCK